MLNFKYLSVLGWFIIKMLLSYSCEKVVLFVAATFQIFDGTGLLLLVKLALILLAILLLFLI